MAESSRKSSSAGVPCDQAPEGWRCTRSWGHPGKCNAIPILRPGDVVPSSLSPDLQRVERGIVCGLAAEFGKGQQHQVTRADGFSIAIAGTRIIVEVREEQA